MDCDFSHDPADVPRLIAACEDGADLALGSRWVDGGGTVNWGLLRRRHLARRLPVRPPRARRRRARPDRRLQVLPPRPCSRRSTATRSPHAATGSRSRAPTGRCGRVSRRRDADHVRRSPRRRVEDERRDRRRGDAAGARPPLEGAPRRRTVIETRRTRRSPTRCSRPTCRCSSTSRRRGAGRAARSSRSSSSSNESTRVGSASFGSTSTRTSARPPATACCRCRR